MTALTRRVLPQGRLFEQTAHRGLGGGVLRCDRLTVATKRDHVIAPNLNATWPVKIGRFLGHGLKATVTKHGVDGIAMHAKEARRIIDAYHLTISLYLCLTHTSSIPQLYTLDYCSSV